MTFLILMFSLLSIDSLIYLALAALLGLQLWLVLRLTSLPKKRLRIRLGLNILLWLVVLLFIVQPEWHYTTDTNRVLLTSSGIPSASVQHIKDSLGIKESFDSKDFGRRILKDPHFIDHLGNIYLMGQEFSPVLLSKLSQKKLIRVPFFKVDELQDIHWKSILSKGDIQEIRGKIEVSEDKVLRIKYAS